MKSKLKSDGKRIILYDDYESSDFAVCDIPDKAIKKIEKAWELNDDRHYTASARMLASCEELPGFKWIE